MSLGTKGRFELDGMEVPCGQEPIEILQYHMVEFGDFQPVRNEAPYLPHALATIPGRFDPTPRPVHEKRVAVVGFGPSLKDTWEYLNDFRDSYDLIISCSGAHRFLLEHGIVPNIHVELDWKPHKSSFTEITHPDCLYVMSALCNIETINNVKDRNAELMFIAHGKDIHYPEDAQIMPMGYDVGQMSINIARILGYRKIDLFGFDCGFDEQGHRHAGDHQGRVHFMFPALVEGRVFYTSKTMFTGLLVMEHMINEHKDTHFTIHGDGLLINFLVGRPHYRARKLKEIENGTQTTNERS